MINETERIIELFHHYALKRLANHKTELSLWYHKASRGSTDLLKLSLKQHKQLFRTELADKIRGLISIQNKFIKPELKEIGEGMIERLN